VGRTRPRVDANAGRDRPTGGTARVAGVAAASDGGRRRELRARLYMADDAPLMVAPVAALVAEYRAQLTDVTIGTPSLEDVLIQLTGRALR
jgi:ABC-2 type transport system ATP-binding protein